MGTAHKRISERLGRMVVPVRGILAVMLIELQRRELTDEVAAVRKAEPIGSAVRSDGKKIAHTVPAGYTRIIRRSKGKPGRGEQLGERFPLKSPGAR